MPNTGEDEVFHDDSVAIAYKVSFDRNDISSWSSCRDSSAGPTHIV
jgi:hypothetical protein